MNCYSSTYMCLESSNIFVYNSEAWCHIRYIKPGIRTSLLKHSKWVWQNIVMYYILDENLFHRLSLWYIVSPTAVYTHISGLAPHPHTLLHGHTVCFRHVPDISMLHESGLVLHPHTLLQGHAGCFRHVPDTSVPRYYGLIPPLHVLLQGHAVCFRHVPDTSVPRYYGLIPPLHVLLQRHAVCFKHVPDTSAPHYTCLVYLLKEHDMLGCIEHSVSSINITGYKWEQMLKCREFPESQNAILRYNTRCTPIMSTW